MKNLIYLAIITLNPLQNNILINKFVFESHEVQGNGSHPAFNSFFKFILKFKILRAANENNFITVILNLIIISKPNL
jgi:hypothetical protein